jgi:hypothetical protein
VYARTASSGCRSLLSADSVGQKGYRGIKLGSPCKSAPIPAQWLSEPSGARRMHRLAIGERRRTVTHNSGFRLTLPSRWVDAARAVPIPSSRRTFRANIP